MRWALCAWILAPGSVFTRLHALDERSYRIAKVLHHRRKQLRLRHSGALCPGDQQSTEQSELLRRTPHGIGRVKGLREQADDGRLSDGRHVLAAALHRPRQAVQERLANLYSDLQRAI
jgi:hypothetical protein